MLSPIEVCFFCFRVITKHKSYTCVFVGVHILSTACIACFCVQLSSCCAKQKHPKHLQQQQQQQQQTLPYLNQDPQVSSTSVNPSKSQTGVVKRLSTENKQNDGK